MPTKTFHADTDVDSAFLVALSSDSLTTSRWTAVWATDVFQRASDDFRCVVLQNWADTWPKRLLSMQCSPPSEVAQLRSSMILFFSFLLKKKEFIHTYIHIYFYNLKSRACQSGYCSFSWYTFSIQGYCLVIYLPLILCASCIELPLLQSLLDEPSNKMVDRPLIGSSMDCRAEMRVLPPLPNPARKITLSSG